MKKPDDVPCHTFIFQGDEDLEKQVRIILEQLRQDGLKEDLIKHIINNQIIPQLIEQMHGNQAELTTALVDTKPDAKGFKVKCIGCGMEATSPVEPPPGKAVICPRCLLENSQS